MLLEEDSPLVVAGGITSGTVVVSDVVAVSVVVSDVVTVRAGVVRVGVVRVGVVRVTPVWVLSAPPAASSAGPERETYDRHEGKHRPDLHEPVKHNSPVGAPHGESLSPV